MVAIVVATDAHAGVWAELRRTLWPRDNAERHFEEIRRALERPADLVAYLAFDSVSTPLGFAEASVRRDYVNGCETSPVVFLEGIHVEDGARGKGVGRRLAEAVALWGLGKGCREFGSDAPVDNMASRRFHVAIGFEETQEVVYFRRVLRDQE